MSDAQYKLELVRWTDSTSSTGWHTSKFQDYRPAQCETVGWVIRDEETYITLAPTIGLVDADVCDCMTIPKAVISERHALGAPS